MAKLQGYDVLLASLLCTFAIAARQKTSAYWKRISTQRSRLPFRKLDSFLRDGVSFPPHKLCSLSFNATETKYSSLQIAEFVRSA